MIIGMCGGMMNLTESNGNLILTDVECLDIPLCLDCGQAFRFTERTDGGFHGVVQGEILDVRAIDGGYIFEHTDREKFEKIWRPYFDLDRNYAEICSSFDDEKLRKAVREFYGIRILKQEPWEALCSFIISQNNNIPRIKGIVERICENFGEKICGSDYSFPSYEILSDKSVEDLAALRAGFRAKYIIDAAQKVSSGEVRLYELDKMPIEDARQELMKIKGVGAKVAECTLLYGIGKLEAFPIDVWVRRIMSEMYPEGLPECTRGVEGIAQQYLFHWRRKSKEFNKNDEEAEGAVSCLGA